MAVLNNWVNGDLSSFYFDIIKDRLYCDEPTGLSRRRTQTVLLHVMNHFMAFLAPVTPALVERAWKYFPPALRKDEIPPLQRAFQSAPPEWSNADLASDLPWLLDAKSAVNAALEEGRNEKQLQQSTESVVHISFTAWDAFSSTVDPRLDFFKRYEGELADLFLTAGVVLHQPSHMAEVRLTDVGSPNANWTHWRPFPTACESVSHLRTVPSDRAKCDRCWKYTASRPSAVAGGKEEDNAARADSLCQRCRDVVSTLTEPAAAPYLDAASFTS